MICKVRPQQDGNSEAEYENEAHDYEQTNDLKCFNDYKIYVIPIRCPNREFVCKMYANYIRGLSKLLSMRVSELRKGSSPATSIPQIHKNCGFEDFFQGDYWVICPKAMRTFSK